jgi:hypothetical protein
VVRGVRDFEIEGKALLGYCGEYIGKVGHVRGRVLPGAVKLRFPRLNAYNRVA